MSSYRRQLRAWLGQLQTIRRAILDGEFSPASSRALERLDELDSELRAELASLDEESFGKLAAQGAA